MSDDVCVRISLLEVTVKNETKRIDSMCEKFEVVEERQREILEILLKVKYLAYGGVIILLFDSVGFIGAVKAVLFGV